MSLTLHYHPLSSYCWKTLIALYENDTPFTPHVVNLGDEAERAALLKLWPIGKFPVLQDDARSEVVPESSIVIAYLDRYYPGSIRFIPDGDLGLQVRLRDRFYDLHVHDHVQKIVGDRLRPRDQVDPFGVEQARAKLRTAWDMIEHDMAYHEWAMGSAFTLADCAALPALFYGNKVLPFVETHKRVAAYLERLLARPSIARVIAQAGPYFHMFPQEASG
ncbi:glutathione S-transferase family protein [Rhodopseudomonas boonkerdii]|uniref:glutathione S-transferase family protein n=1 Tax=Rhodopseudomonas boonkerdii TaxID=475937 RepID=UPI001E3F39EA|nr:glutathione S-transferase family protein [Rhodopseudomonas boonkerdii]UGV25504.1 glutathione S-transferase family protein [Rhodopseudomonas boonkerdii]